MIGKSPDQNQKNIFRPLLKEIIKPNHPLVILSKKIDWKELEEDFSGFYSHTGLPAKPIRLMVGLLILKQLYNLSDERVVPAWVENPYYQYFCGEAEFQWEFPCDPSDLVHFRHRIGKEGVERILKLSVDLQPGEDYRGRDVIVDTTVQEKNITYPTDAKLYRRIIHRCRKIAKDENIILRQSYTRIEKHLMIEQRFGHHPRRRKKANKARRKLKTIAGRLVREMERKLSPSSNEQYQHDMDLFKRVLSQKRNDSDKIYSLHEPEVSCIAKGKSHKKYEYGSKVSFAMLPGSNIVVGVVNFQGNPHDSTTLESALEQAERISGKKFKNAIVDRGYRGKKKIGTTKVLLPGSPKGKSDYQKRSMRKKCRSRSAIEPVIGHIKIDHRMERNYLKGTVGDEINSILAGAALNFKRLLRKFEQEIIFSIFNILKKGQNYRILTLEMAC
jgi:IS5 family transposase